jgi:hypothetical protein
MAQVVKHLTSKCKFLQYHKTNKNNNKKKKTLTKCDSDGPLQFVFNGQHIHRVQKLEGIEDKSTEKSN